MKTSAISLLLVRDRTDFRSHEVATKKRGYLLILFSKVFSFVTRDEEDKY